MNSVFFAINMDIGKVSFYKAEMKHNHNNKNNNNQSIS